MLTVNGKPVGPVGYGMLALSIPWARVEFEAAAQLLKTALTHGANFWNGSLHYGTPDNNTLHLLRYYFERYPEDASKVVISIKGAYHPVSGPQGSPSQIRASVEEALAILPPSVKLIDTFQCGRVDPKVPIETSISALATLVSEGKIGGIGISEASAETIRRAHAVHPIAVAEIELSLFTPDPLHNGIRDTCAQLGIPIAAYSPIGRGWLTGELKSVDDLAEDDFRRKLPRFSPEHFGQNLKLVQAVERVALRKGVTVAQVALGWCVAQGALPIPGSTKEGRIAENCQPARLDEEDLVELGRILEENPVAGQRYGGVHEAALNG